MPTQQYTSTLVFLFSAIGLLVLPHVQNLPGNVFGLFYLLLAWRFLGIRKPALLPNRWFLLLITVASISLLLYQHHGILGRDAGTRLFVIALGLKLLEIKSDRDIYLISFLAFVVAASQFLYQQSILMALYILAVCTGLLGSLICINSIQPEAKVALKTAFSIILQAVPIAVVIFIFFPRITAPRWLYFNEDHQTKTGLSDSLEPGSISSLSMSDELVFRVKFTGRIPPPAQRYWRGPVLTITDGKKWTQSPDLQYRQLPEKPQTAGLSYLYTLLMEPQEKNWVFALDMPGAFPDNLKMNANYQLLTSERPDKRAEYSINSFPNYHTGKLSKLEFINSSQLPGEPSDRIKALAKQLHGFDQSAQQYMQHILDYFHRENFHYTLNPPLMPNNPIETFLLDTRYGLCSHYATAFVYLMRVAHIPARVVTGYQGGELNKVGNFLDIRQAHAHAWAEVWLPNAGWSRVDPTAAIAPDRIERDLNVDQQIASGLLSFNEPGTAAKNAYQWLKQMRQFWGNVDYNWQRWVINYDNTNQAQFLKGFGIEDLKTMLFWLVGMIAGLTGLLSLWLFRRQAGQDPVLLYYQRYCRKLSKLGLFRQPGEGAKTFAKRSIALLPHRKREIRQITALFLKLRYGRRRQAADFVTFKRLISRFSINKAKDLGCNTDLEASLTGNNSL